MKELIQKLEAAVLRRNPLLGEKLQPGLPVEIIKKDLKRAGINGPIDAIIELYSWKNGTVLDIALASSRTGFVPEPIFQFTQLKRSILNMKSFREYARYHSRLSVLVDRFFPLLWDGSNGWIALDIDSSGDNRVVMIQLQEKEPLREAYNSFENFLKDVIRSNESGDSLLCIQTPGNPIVKIASNYGEPADKPVSVSKTRIKKGQLLATEKPLVLRTDFSNDSAWKLLCAAIQDSSHNFGPGLNLVSEIAYDGLKKERLLLLFPKDISIPFVFLVDRTALTSPNYPVLVIDLIDEPGRMFRVRASALKEVASNLSVANMGFDEFAEAVDQDGIFRFELFRANHGPRGAKRV